MTDVRNIGGHWLPAPHRGWGGFAEELFHHTSRYYVMAESFLRTLGDDAGFSMSGYRAAILDPAQRDLMGAILSYPPTPETAAAVIALVHRVLAGEAGIDPVLEQRYLDPVRRLTHGGGVAHASAQAGESVAPGVGPLDPFLNLAERLLLPVAVRDHHVEVSMHALAAHLDSANPALRTNLHNALLLLHNGGYVLRNHPDLTHAEADAISRDDD